MATQTTVPTQTTEAPASSGFKIPGKNGSDAGKPLHLASDSSLDWWANKIDESLQKGESKYPDKDRPLLEAMRAEQKRRAGSAKERAVETQVAVAKIEREVVGTVRSATDASERMHKAVTLGHLVSPATDVGQLPEGCAVALSVVQVDVEHETYNLMGKRGLGKAALDKIAGAAGVSWDPNHTRRLDNGRNPHYAHYKAVGAVRLFDGQLRVITGEVEIDAREGSPQIDEIRKKAAKRATEAEPGDGGESQILELRKFLLRHAESKAKLRAIRSLGIRTSYEAAELKKPFVVARVMFTGQSEDPAIRQMFAAVTANSFMNGTAALYGPPAQLLQAAPQTARPTVPALTSGGEGHDAPPIEAARVDPDDDEAPEPGSFDGDDDEPPAAGAAGQQKLY